MQLALAKFSTYSDAHADWMPSEEGVMYEGQNQDKDHWGH